MEAASSGPERERGRGEGRGLSPAALCILTVSHFFLSLRLPLARSLTTRAHLPAHNVAHRSRGSQPQPNPPVACVNSFPARFSLTVALIALGAKRCVSADTRLGPLVTVLLSFFFCAAGTSRGGAAFTVSTVNVDTDIVPRVSC